jgi:hypothetical protein
LNFATLFRGVILVVEDHVANSVLMFLWPRR